MKKLLLVFYILIATVSCIKDIDFNQANAIKITPIIKSTLIHFNVTESNFVTTNYKTDISEFQLFKNDVAQNNVVKIDFLFEMNNTFNKDVNISYRFLDKDLNIVGAINLLSESSTNRTETVTFDNTTINTLVEARLIQVYIEILNTTDITSEMHFNFKSAAHIHLIID